MTELKTQMQTELLHTVAQVYELDKRREQLEKRVTELKAGLMALEAAEAKEVKEE